ncbi:autophagy- protein 2 [Rhizophlyctis rosea]|nr:autophagy- protein 2 [Rhizophlyctis rosea]
MSSSLWPFSTRLIPQSLQKRLLKFLLKRAIGQFLATELNLANLDVELSEGRVVLKDLDLNVDLLNDLAVDLPFVVTDGRISQITAVVPWMDIWTGNCSLELDELYIEITPIPEDPNHGLSKSMADSEAHLMSSSVHFAEDFLKQEVSGDEDSENLFRQMRQPRKPPGSSPRTGSSGRSAPSTPWSNPDPGLDGLQALTRLIDKIMAKVNVAIRNINLRVVHTAFGGRGQMDAGVYHLDLAIPLVTYSDETPGLDDDAQDAGFPSEIIKKIRFDEVKVKLGKVEPPMPQEDIANEMEGETGDASNGFAAWSQRTRYLWLVSLAEAREENWVRLVIDRKKAPAGRADPASSNTAQSELSVPASWDIQVFVKALCGLITPDKYAILLGLAEAFGPAARERVLRARMHDMTHDAYGTDSEASMSDAVPRDFGEAGAYRRAAGLAFDSDDEPEHFQPEMAGGWPGAPTTPIRPITNSYSQPTPQENAQPASIRFSFEIATSKLYIALEDPSSVPRFDVASFFHMFFNGGSSSAVPASAFPADLSDSFVREANTAFNAGTGGTVEDLMGDLLSVSHFKLGVEAFVVRYGMQRKAGEKLPVVDFEAGGVDISEWNDGKRGKRKYESVVWLGQDVDVGSVKGLYEQLAKKEPPQAKRFAPPKGKKGERGRNKPVLTGKYSLEDDGETFQSRVGGRSDLVQNLSVELAPVQIFGDPTIVERVQTYMGLGSDAGRADGRAGLGSARNAPGRIIDDLDDARSSKETRVRKNINIRGPLFRLWVRVPDMRDAEFVNEVPVFQKPCRPRPEMLVVDLVNPVLTTSMGDSSTRTSISLGYDPEVGVSRWNLQCSDIGIAISRNQQGRDGRGTGDVLLKPLVRICASHHASTTPTSKHPNTSDSLPNIELTLRPKVALPADRSGFTIHTTPSGLKLNRANSEEEESANGNANTFGLKSWYDVGTSGKEKERGGGERQRGDADGDDDLIWFKQRTIAQSVLFLNCIFPACDMVVSKRDFDLLQVLLNDLAIWQPAATVSALAADSVLGGGAPDASFTSTNFHMARSHVTAIGEGSVHHGLSDSREFRGTEFGGYQLGRGPMAGSERDTVEMTALSAAVSVGSVQGTILCAVEQDVGLYGTEYRTYNVKLEDVRVFDATGYTGKPISYLWIDSENVRVSGDVLPHTSVDFIYRTLPLAAKSRPMLSSSIMLSFDKELNMKETTASLTFNGMTVRVAEGGEWVGKDLAAFGKEAEGITYVDVASRFTKLYVNLGDFCVELRPSGLDIRAVVALDSLTVSTNLIPDSPTLGLKVILYNATVFMLEDRDRIRVLDEEGTVGGRMVGYAVEKADLGGYADVRKFWNALGFASVASVDALELSLRTNSGDVLPNFELEAQNNQMYIDTCADSFGSLQKLLAYFTTGGAGGGVEREAESPADIPDELGSPMTSPVTHDLLGSLDENAFRRRSEDFMPSTKFGSTADSNLIFEDDFYGGGGTGNLGKSVFIDPEVRSPEKTQNAHGNAGFGTRLPVQDDVVRVFHDTESFSIIEDHFAGSHGGKVPKARVSEDAVPKDVTHIKLRDFDITWRIFDGYDWEHTRKHVFEQKAKAKRTRRAGKQPATEPQGQAYAQPSKLSSRRSSLGSVTGGMTGTSPSSNPFDNGISGMGYIGRDFEDVGVDGDHHATHTSLSQSPHHGVDDWDRDDDFDTASNYSGTSGVSGRSRQTVPRSPSAIGRITPQTADDLTRSSESRVEFRAFHLNLEFDVYPKTSQRASRVLVSVRDIEIIDNVRTSLWRKFLSHLRPESGGTPRETESDMVRVELVSVRPDVKNAENQELRLKVRLLPLRMYVDQDALTCLIRFFSFENGGKETAPRAEKSDDAFFQFVEIDPIVLKVDYKPKHVDFANLKGGNLVEIMNFFHLDGAEMTLRNVRMTGIKGWPRLFNDLFKQWLPHIRSTQVPKVMSGVAGVRSLVNVGNGVADLILLPIEQYKKDGRIVRGLQRGAKSFAKAATLETIKLGTRLAVGTQVMLEHADDILSFDQSNEYNDGWDVDETGSIIPATVYSGGSAGGRSTANDQVSKFSEQPKDLKEGIGLAYGSLRRGVGTAAKTILAVPMEVYETGTEGTVRAVIRAMPVAVLKPMIGATEAVSKTLMGIQNTIDPNKRLQMEDKYKA